MSGKNSKPTREKPTRHIQERLKAQLIAGKALLLSFDDGIPLSANGRREYVSRVAVFYESVLRKRLERMVLDQLLELERFGLREDETLFIRANINALNLMDDWFRERVAEHIGDVEEIRKNEIENAGAEEINRIKEVIGE